MEFVNEESHLIFFPVSPQVQKLMRKKQLDVAEFSIYWDVDCTLLGDLPQVELQVRFWQKALLEQSTGVRGPCHVAVCSLWLWSPSHPALPPSASVLKWVCLRYLVCM